MRHPVVLFSVRFLFLLVASSTGFYGYAQTNVPGDSSKNVTTIDSLKKADNLQAEDLKRKSDIKSPIKYSADEYMLLDVKNKILYLHKGGKLVYEDMSLDADSVSVNWETNTLEAKGIKDSTGQIIGQPVLTDGDQNYSARELKYNIKTQKGLVTGARTKQGEEYILADHVKKENDSTYYISQGKFTSCDHEHPHYYIKSNKLKVIPQDKIITGPLMLVIEDFPLPLILPFGFFPNQTGQRAGLVMPTYGEAADRGFFLRNGGYYTPISDKMDLLLRGDIFSKGGWRLEASTSYKDRYRYNGTFQIEYGVQKFGEFAVVNGDTFADPNYRKSAKFWVTWKHDQTITPQATLRADVNAGSTTFLNQFSYNEQDYLTSTLRSNVTYRQTFANSPYSFNLGLDHSQNTQTSQVSMTLPNFALNRTRWFPFKGANSTGSKWYHKIGLTYSMNAKNQINVPDSLLDDVLFRPQDDLELVTINSEGDTTSREVRRALDYYKNGIQHFIPINTQLNVAQYINLTPAFNFREYWYIKETQKTWDAVNNEVVEQDIYGFKTARDFNFNMNASTRLYGIFNLGGKRKPAIRHTMQPSLGYTFKPDFSTEFWGYFREVQTDTSGGTQIYSRFEDGILGGPSRGEQQQLNFNLNNILEMKIRKKDADQDTTIKDPFSRFALLDGFGVSANYNFAADSLNLSFVSMNARTNILNNKFSIQSNASFDPYAVSETGQRINTFRYERNGTIARLNNLRIAFNARMQSKRNTGPTRQDEQLNINEAEYNDVQYFRDLYVDFNIPWTLNLSYSLNYTNTGIRRDTTMTMNFSGDVNLTPKWKLGFTSGYDFNQRDFSYTSMSIYRDLHCWEMSMTWIPFGERKSYNLSINVKSATLKDLKLTKRRDWQDRF